MSSYYRPQYNQETSRRPDVGMSGTEDKSGNDDTAAILDVILTSLDPAQLQGLIRSISARLRACVIPATIGAQAATRISKVIQKNFREATYDDHPMDYDDPPQRGPIGHVYRHPRQFSSATHYSHNYYNNHMTAKCNEEGGRLSPVYTTPAKTTPQVAEQAKSKEVKKVANLISFDELPKHVPKVTAPSNVSSERNNVSVPSQPDSRHQQTPKREEQVIITSRSIASSPNITPEESPTCEKPGLAASRHAHTTSGKPVPDNRDGQPMYGQQISSSSRHENPYGTPYDTKNVAVPSFNNFMPQVSVTRQPTSKRNSQRPPHPAPSTQLPTKAFEYETNNVAVPSFNSDFMAQFTQQANAAAHTHRTQPARAQRPQTPVASSIGDPKPTRLNHQVVPKTFAGAKSSRGYLIPSPQTVADQHSSNMDSSSNSEDEMSTPARRSKKALRVPSKRGGMMGSAPQQVKRAKTGDESSGIEALQKQMAAMMEQLARLSAGDP